MTHTAFGQKDDSMVFLTHEELEPWWVVEKNFAPVYPQRMLSKGLIGCVTIGYIIESDGSTSNHRAIAAYPSDGFNESGINAAKRFQYKPAPGNASSMPVFTFNTFTYQIAGAGRKSDVQVRSDLAELCDTAALQQLRPDTKAPSTGAEPSAQ